MDEEQREQYLEHAREIYLIRVQNMDKEQIAQRREREAKAIFKRKRKCRCSG